MANQNNDRDKRKQNESQNDMNRDRDVDQKGGESSRDMDDLGNLNDDSA